MGSETHVREISTWLGAPSGPLFGRVTFPTGGLARGGVLITPPIGREARLARRGLRTLAYRLSDQGFVVVRFDHHGTGDSTGSIEDDTLMGAWSEGIGHGVEFLRSLDISVVSVVGLRMGATILGAAARAHPLGVESAVLWDPCETGRSYLREARALAALRRNELTNDRGEPLDMSEYSYSDDAKSRIGEITLLTPSTTSLAPRLLIVTRATRSVSENFRSRWEPEASEWYVSSEQEAMLDTEVPASIEPTSTLQRIAQFICDADFAQSAFVAPVAVTTSSIPWDHSGAVSESVVALGPRHLFGIVSEPQTQSHGPLMVLVNGFNEDHVGPSRAWVELSRRWASEGLRCVRFDFRDLGESPWTPGTPRSESDVQGDVEAVIEALAHHGSDGSVPIGLCSGAQVALDVALDLKTSGLVTVNPRLGRGVVNRAVVAPASTAPKALRTASHHIEEFLARNRWVGKLIWQFARLVLPSPYVGRVKRALATNGTKTLLIVSDDEISPFPWIPYIGTIDRRRLVSSEYRQVQIVPQLDHDFLSVPGRQIALEAIDRFVRENFVTPGDQP